MKKHILVLSVAILILGCSQPKTNKQAHRLKMDTFVVPIKKSTINDLVEVYPADKDRNGRPGWVDSLMDSYIKQTNNKLVKNAVKEQLQEGWSCDGIEKTDTATYLVFKVGHDASNGDGTDPRYITDSWVYIDSLTRKLYEYNAANEKIVEWGK